MDPSIVKLLEEDDEGMHSEVDVYTLQAALTRDIQGENHYSSQQFATGNNGDANANLHRQDVFESTQTREVNLPQDHRQPGKVWENPCHVPQSNEMKSRSNPIGNEPERPQPQYMKRQKMSSQQVHEVEQPVDSVNHGPTQAQICEFLRFLIDNNQHDKDREMYYLSMYYKVKRKETTTEEFVQHMKDRMGDQITKSIISKMRHLQLGNTEIKVSGSPNHYRMSFPSEISAQEPDAGRVHVNQLPSTTSGTLSSSGTVQGLNKHSQQHIHPPSASFHKDTNSGGFNTYPRTDFTSPDSSSGAKLPDFQTRHMANTQNMGSTSIEGPTNSTTNMKTDPKFERPSYVHGPSKIHGGSISHFQNNSSLPLHSDPSQVSVTKDQTVCPSSSVVHVKQKSIDQSFGQAQKPLSLAQQGVTNVPLKQNNAFPSRSDDDLEKQSSKMVLSTSITSASSVSPSMTTQLDSNTMVNLPAASVSFPAGAKVRKTSKMPSVGRKKPLEELGSSLPPSRKKQKLCESSSDQSIEKFNDVTAVSGINLREEENQLLYPGRKKRGRVSKASQKVVQEEEERTILQKLPLQRMLTDIMAKSGIKHIDHGVEQCLSVERMRGLLFNTIRVSKQRIDAEKCRNRTFVTSDIRKQINEMNQRVKEEWEKKHAGEEKNGDNDSEKENKRSDKLKVKKDADERRAKAANVAVHAAVGGDATFLKWKLMAEARQKLSSGPGKKFMKLSGETGGTESGKNRDLSKVVRSISVKDVIAVVEKEPQMRRSTLLYRLYNRICSDV